RSHGNSPQRPTCGGRVVFSNPSHRSRRDYQNVARRCVVSERATPIQATSRAADALATYRSWSAQPSPVLGLTQLWRPGEEEARQANQFACRELCDRPVIAATTITESEKTLTG